jgi:ATP-binding cassette, subfamily B, bacterial
MAMTVSRLSRPDLGRRQTANRQIGNHMKDGWQMNDGTSASNKPVPTPGIVAEMGLMLRRGREVWRLVPSRHKWALAGAVVIMVGTSACSTTLALFLGQLVDGVKPDNLNAQTNESHYRMAALWLGLIGTTYVVREILNVLRRYLVTNTCTRINRDMSLQLVQHMMSVSLATLQCEKVGTLQGRILRSVDGLVRFLRLNFMEFIPAVFTGLFALAAAIYKAPLLGLVMLGVIPVTIILTIRQLLSQKSIRLQLMSSCEEIDSAVVEQLGGIEYVRAADTMQLEMNRLARATEKRRAMEVRHHFQMSLFGGAKALNEGLVHIIVLAVAIYLAIQGRISIGDVLAFSLLYLNLMTPLGEIHRVLDEGHESSLQVGELLEMMAEPIDPSFATSTLEMPRLQPGEPAVVIDDLHVEYVREDEKHPQTLHGISLTIRHGETIGIAGRSGGGKSTLLRVLLRLIHPCGGTVLVGGVSLDAVSRAAIGKLFGYVGQSPFVFAGTITENIAYGNKKASPEAIRRAAEMAHLHDEILLMPGGYEAPITERGQNLSGGQRQRLAIARILLKQPPILILDEATSALDNISEREVQRALGMTSVDRTTILVAHRLSTLRDADRIFVFDEGRIVEVGNFDHLVAAGGVFTELFMSAESGSSPHTSPGPPAVEPAGPAICAGEAVLENAVPHSPGSALAPIPAGDMV